MKKLVLILSLIFVALCIVACLRQKDAPTDPTDFAQPGTTTTGTLPAPSVPPTTEAVPDGWYDALGHRYYYINGEPVTGWQEIDGLRRYFLSDGALANGFAEVDGSTHYFDTDGCFVTGWLDLDGKRYYLGEDGYLVTGWLELEEVLYYFREDGAMARGRVEIDGVNNYFTSTGAYILILNPWNYLPEGYEPDLVELGSHYATSGNRVDRSCYDALTEMIDACNKACPRVCVLSGYRSMELQTKNFNRKVNSYIKKGYSQEEAERLAAMVVAVPGTSEHHTGLAVDIIDTRMWALEEEQEELPAQQWLMEHSWEYGFILRYPKDKTEITGIIYEPWHYRYVGKELAAELHELGVTLEEYMEMLTEE